MDSSTSHRDVDVPRLLDALGLRWQLKGGEHWACCPKHGEKTASWSMSDTGSFHCFGCQWAGGPVDLVMRVLDVGMRSTALEWMRENHVFVNGTLPLNVELHLRRETQVTEMSLPTGVRVGVPMDKWVTPARRYAESRGVTPEQVARWALGYAVGGFFNGRLMLPTHDRHGGLLNLTGRTFLPSGSPKYLRSRQQDGVVAGAVFGERFWPTDPRGHTVVVNEGELNALACERAGAEYVAALGGSSLEKEQVMKLSRFGRVVIATDSDLAGNRIARQLHSTLSRWVETTRVVFPGGQDANDLEMADRGKLREMLCLELAS